MKRLRDIRIKSGKTQKEVALDLGISRSNYSRYENGLRKMDPEMLVAVAEYFGVSVDYLLGKEDVNPEVLEYIDELKEREDLQMLIIAARDVKKEDIEKAIRIIKALKD